MIRLGVIMDPISSIKIAKDSTFAMLLEAQRRGWQLSYMEQHELYLREDVSHGRRRNLTVTDNPDGWFELGEPEDVPLHELDVILMRKDPPVDSDYLYTTHLLELAEQRGTLVVNRPGALRDMNEKLYTARFNDCTVSTLVSADPQRLRAFLDQHGDIILKPLDLMGGASIFRLRRDDPNTGVILETMTAYGRKLTMAQRYIPEISAGDKRILLIDGEPVPYALARVPAEGETRGNLAVGARGVGVELSERDRWICDQVAPVLREQGILFAGLDVIGDFLTEVNVTSPTCIRELDSLYGLNIAGMLMDRIQARLG